MRMSDDVNIRREGKAGGYADLRLARKAFKLQGFP